MIESETEVWLFSNTCTSSHVCVNVLVDSISAVRIKLPGESTSTSVSLETREDWEYIKRCAHELIDRKFVGRSNSWQKCDDVGVSTMWIHHTTKDTRATSTAIDSRWLLSPNKLSTSYCTETYQLVSCTLLTLFRRQLVRSWWLLSSPSQQHRKMIHQFSIGSIHVCPTWRLLVR